MLLDQLIMYLDIDDTIFIRYNGEVYKYSDKLEIPTTFKYKYLCKISATENECGECFIITLDDFPII